VNVSYVRDLEFCFCTCTVFMYVRYICLGTEVLSTKLDAHHSDHTWRTWQCSVMRGMCEPDVSAAHWSCSIHVRLSACMDVFIKWSVQQMCAVSVMQNIDMMCVRREIRGRFDSPLTHTSQTIQSWRERHSSWKHPSSNTISNLIQC